MCILHHLIKIRTFNIRPINKRSSNMMFNVNNGVSSDGVMHTIVARNGYARFMEFVREMRVFKDSYQYNTRNKIGFTMFEYCSDGIHKSKLEAKELYWWCIGHDVI